MKNKLLLTIFSLSLLCGLPFTVFASVVSHSTSTKAHSLATRKTKIYQQQIAFVAQAPYGNWKDLRQEDGCEEASSLMAIRWSQNKTLTKAEALKKILASSAYTQKKYGEYRDLSTRDTLNWVIKDFFQFSKAVRKTAVTKDDIIKALKNGQVVIAPMNGQLLHNPYYTAPGPLHHMLLISGYDPNRKRFITNDPGTRRGDGYAYDEDVLYKAISDYPTGWHRTATSIQKNIIIISK